MGVHEPGLSPFFFLGLGGFNPSPSRSQPSPSWATTSAPSSASCCWPATPRGLPSPASSSTASSTSACSCRAPPRLSARRTRRCWATCASATRTSSPWWSPACCDPPGTPPEPCWCLLIPIPAVPPHGSAAKRCDGQTRSQPVPCLQGPPGFSLSRPKIV